MPTTPATHGVDMLRAALPWLLVGLLAACEHAPPDRATPTTSPETPVRSPVLWKHLNEATVVAVNDQSIENALVEATRQAQQSLEDARKRWAVAKPAERSLWAVKWAAPLRIDPDSRSPRTIEYVWVQPVNWSPFRIEGVLLSTPTSPLDCGRSRGEIVGFPIDELTDWMHVASEAPDAAFEGGFSVKVLEARYGRDPG